MITKIQPHAKCLDTDTPYGKELNSTEELRDHFDDDLCSLFKRYLPENYRFFDDVETAPCNQKFELCADMLKEVLTEVRNNPIKELED